MGGILCPSCRHRNIEKANFCGLCGTSLAGSPEQPAESSRLDDALDLLKILEITNAINSTLDLEKVLSLVLAYSVEITQGQRGFLILRGPDGKLQFRAAQNMDYKELSGKDHTISRRALGMALEKGEIVATVSAQQDSIFSTSRSVIELDLQAIICIPLKVSPHDLTPAEASPTSLTIGAIYIDSKLPIRYFTPEKRNLLEVMANSAAIAIKNARLYNELKIQKRRVEATASSLEEMVKVRTEELNQKNIELVQTIDDLRRLQSQLVQAEKMATVGTLAGGVAHEINNPLGSILSNAQRILRYACPEEKHTASAELVQEGARRCRSIVENLLSFSRQSDSTLRSLDLNGVLDGTLSLLDHHLGIHNVRIQKEYGQLPPVLANQNELSQVFTNLLINARDAICETLGEQKPFGTVVLRTGVRGNQVIIEIQDDGPGIPAVNLTKLFDPFFTTKEVGRGTGLGLYISLGIIQRHGGNIEAESRPGEGAIFRVVLPVKEKLISGG
jgi:signal transduction histidine kinase